MSPPADPLANLERLLARFPRASGRVALLSGAGISAESGIPTFRGPEGTWRVGSREYRPEEMATRAWFEHDPWEVWSWYLYRRTVCGRARPNPGHAAAAELETILGDRFRLITQNVDGLHLRAGSTLPRTWQIHGNLHFMRCARECSGEILGIPDRVGPRGRNETVPAPERKALVCPRCGTITRPHVLWFDEFYNEAFFHADSALQWALGADLLLVVGTSGATTLPVQIGEIFARRPDAAVVDINPEPNPFRALAEAHPCGVALAGRSAELLPRFVQIWKQGA